MRYRKVECAEVNLDELGLRQKHADWLLVCGNTVIVVEETEHARLDDVEQLDQTLESCRSGELQRVVRERVSDEPVSYYGVLHARSVSSMVVRALRARSRRKRVPIECASCDEEVARVIDRILQRRP
jgi:hypothetical protein